MCKWIFSFPSFPTILTLIMYEYSKNSKTDRLSKGLENSFWTADWKNISFLTLKSWKNMYFSPKKAGILSFDRRGHFDKGFCLKI